MELLIATNLATLFTLLVFFFHLFSKKEDEYQNLLKFAGSMKVILFTILIQNGGELVMDGNIKIDDINTFKMCSEFDKDKNTIKLKLVEEKNSWVI